MALDFTVPLRGSGIQVTPPYVVETAAEIAAPLPPLEWVCEGLRLARGTVTIVAGYGYSRKTLYAQSLCLAAATGGRALGVYQCERVAALHVDGEQGHRITRGRYQRMAASGGVDLGTAALSAVTFPRFRLTDPDAAETLARLLEETGAGLVVVDSLKALTAGVDENSSEIREGIDAFGGACKRANAAGILIHHARKPSGEGGATKYSLRGSSAIFDAADSIFVFLGEKGRPTRVEHEKDRLIGTELDSFGIDSADVQIGSDPRGGLVVSHLEAAQIEACARQVESESAAKGRQAATTAIVNTLAALPDRRWPGSRSALAVSIGGRKGDTMAAIAELIAEGRVIEILQGRRNLGLELR